MDMAMKTRPQMFLQARSTDKNIFLDALQYFDGFQVWATMPTSMVDWVREVGKPFFVDPMSYVFPLPTKQLMDKDETKLRPCITKLASNYSDLIANTLSQRSITSQDILSQLSTLEEIVSRCLQYQRTKFDTAEPELFNANYEKYDRLAGQGITVPHVNNAVAPFTLLPPYFLFHDVGDPWYTATLRCARIARKFTKAGESLSPVLLLGKSCLNPIAVAKIIKDFKDADVDGFILWINALSEEDAKPSHIASLSALISGLSQNGRTVYKLYGGYLSLLLHNQGLTGFSTSVAVKTGYSVRSYGGYAVPAKPKFYIPLLHRSYPLEEASQIIRAHPFLACGCLVCLQSYGGDLDRMVSQMTNTGYCENHFLNARRGELDRIQSYGVQPVVAEIDDTLARLGSDASEAEHLGNWRTAISTTLPATRMIPPPKPRSPAAAAFTAIHRQ